MNATRESKEHHQGQNRGRAHPLSQQAAGEVRRMNERGSHSQAANAAQASGQAATLLAIIYSEFDNTLGPTIRCQVPEGFLSQGFFDSISDYVITGRQLYGRTVAVTACDLQVVGFPLCIENEKYSRNTFLFNVSFVLRADADPTPYEPILRKLALTLHTLEVESEFIFRPEKKAHLHDMLHKILTDLNAREECLLALDDANVLSLKLTRVVQEPPLVGDHDVPVFLRDAAVLKSLDWDLALRQIISHIDGVKYTKRLAMDAEMDVDCAKAALRTLAYYDFIALVDIFQFSNIYITSTTEAAAFRAFAKSPALLMECQGFVCNHAAAVTATLSSIGAATPDTSDGGVVGEEGRNGEPGRGEGGGPGRGEEAEGSTACRLLPSGEDLLQLYGACRPNLTLAEVLQTHKEKMSRIDARRFVTFGVVYGFLRRVHRYPVYIRKWNKGTEELSSSKSSISAGLITMPPNRPSSLPRARGAPQQHHHHQHHHHQQQRQEEKQQQQQQFSRPGFHPHSLVDQVKVLLDGTRTMDEVCVAFMRPFQELEEIVLSAGDGEVLIVYK